MGCVTQVGEQALNVGRGAVLVAGWPETVCATTVDRQCGSSLQAAFNAASAVQAGHLDLVVAAGVEHMTRVPMGSNLGEAGWGAVNEKIGERWPIVPQGISAEVIAEEWRLDSRGARRVLARVSPARRGSDRRGQVRERDRSGRGRRGRRRRALRGRRDAETRHVAREARRRFSRHSRPDGVVTAGNSSSIVDGSAAMLARERGGGGSATASSRVRASSSFGLSGVDPYRMLHGNPEACARALDEGRTRLGRRLRHRGQRGVRLGRPPVPGGHRTP